MFYRRNLSYNDKSENVILPICVRIIRHYPIKRSQIRSLTVFLRVVQFELSADPNQRMVAHSDVIAIFKFAHAKREGVVLAWSWNRVPAISWGRDFDDGFPWFPLLMLQGRVTASGALLCEYWLIWHTTPYHAMQDKPLLCQTVGSHHLNEAKRC